MRGEDNTKGVLGLIAIGLVCLFLMGGCCISLIGGLMPEYSDGVRIGTLYKFSHKGWLYKSWEGELLLNEFAMSRKGSDSNENVFAFSCVDDSIAHKVEALEGQRVKLHYKQWLIGPITQGTQYYVTGIEPLPK